MSIFHKNILVLLVHLTNVAFIPRKEAGSRPAMIVELKWNKDADIALKQIKEKRNQGALSGYSDEILLVGISYDKDGDSKKHTCKIEKSTI